MSKRSVAEWLDDIISWGERLEGHLAGMTYRDFLNDAKTQRPSAVSKLLSGIDLSDRSTNLRQKYPRRAFPSAGRRGSIRPAGVRRGLRAIAAETMQGERQAFARRSERPTWCVR
jgi:hypothetical protein